MEIVESLYYFVTVSNRELHTAMSEKLVYTIGRWVWAHNNLTNSKVKQNVY